MNQIKKFRYFNIVLTVITILILTCFAYFYYTKNIETIKIHVPLFGEIDTGITNYQLNQFIDAQKEYDIIKVSLNKKFKNKIITEKEFNNKMAQISLQYLSDDRITAVTSGPAKKFINYLLKQ